MWWCGGGLRVARGGGLGEDTVHQFSINMSRNGSESRLPVVVDDEVVFPRSGPQLSSSVRLQDMMSRVALRGALTL